jgi:uncharacterized protein (TIGR00252 family)
MKSNYASGHDAEKRVAEYLEAQGFKILELNWRTRWCEIDIIAAKDGAVYFVEVKSRKSAEQGTGFDYVTPKKLKQMKFAAEFWLADRAWNGESVLSAAAVGGDLSIDFIDDIAA